MCRNTVSSETTPLTKSNNAASHLKRLKAYQGWAFFVTFGSYFMAHFSRKCCSTVKQQLHSEAGYSVFTLSEIDTAFFATFAVGNILCGKLGDTYSPSIVLTGGLFGSGFCLFTLCASLWLGLEIKDSTTGNFFIIILFCLFGFFQATGPPSGTAIMGNWFCDKASVKNRGLIFGFWTCHKHCGSLASALCAAFILDQGYPYWWALLIPAIMSIQWGLLTAQLIADPSDVDIITEDVRIRLKKNEEKKKAGDFQDEGPTAISFAGALSIPMVPQYTIAFGFFKLIHLVLYFWLPYFLGHSFDPSTANLIAAVYSIGNIPGSITIGYVSDLLGGRRASVIGVFMSFLIVILSIFSQKSEEFGATALLIILGLIGVVVGGPNNIIATAVSVDLASHPSVRGSKKSLGTVTGIINGSAAMIASFGLSAVGPLHSAYGWSAIWLYLIGCAAIGTLLLTPKIWSEIFPPVKEEIDEIV